MGENAKKLNGNNSDGVQYKSLDDIAEKTYLPSDTLCGCGSYTPTAIQRCSHPVIFTGHVGLLIAVVACGFTYFSGILTTIERQFQLSSSEVAALIILNDAASLCLILIVTYFGQKGHRPRWIACGALMISVGLVCCALPHFLSDPIDPQSLIEGGTGTTSQESEMSGVCELTTKSAGNQTQGDQNNSTLDKCQEVSSTEGVGSVKWIVVGQIIMGCGNAPLYPLILSYIDDAVKKHKFTSYTAYMFIAIMIGPIAGLFLTSAATSRYVDFDRIPADQIPDIHQYDPRWIGAWWLGFPLLAILLVISAIPMFFYPKVMSPKLSDSDNDGSSNEEGVEENDNLTTSMKPPSGGILRDASGGIIKVLKGLFQTMKRLICNVPFMLLCFGAAAETAIGAASQTFQVKYLQIQFGTSPATAALVMGGFMVPCVMVAQIVSAVICRRFKLDTKQCAAFILACHVIGLLFLIADFFIGCGNSPVAGINAPYSTNETYITSQVNATSMITRSIESACNSDCACAEEIFRPVCGADGVSYISPCHAGCTQFNGSDFKEYYGCSCISTENPDSDSDTAVPDLCLGSCNANLQLVIFVAIGMITAFCLSLTFNPTVFVTFRVVELDDRAIALGFESVITKCLGFFPAPILMGVAINSTCILWQYTCGDRGSCWLYDVLAYRYLFIGLCVAGKCLSVICFGLVYLTIKTPKNEDVEQKEMTTIGEKSAPI